MISWLRSRPGCNWSKVCRLASWCVLFHPGLSWCQTSAVGNPDLKTNAIHRPELTLAPSVESIWKGEIGDGFKSGACETGAAVGLGLGMKVLLSERAHDLALAKAHFGWVFSDLRSQNKWYRGNWELLVELFAGAQFRPDADYVVGIGPLLRYNFATRSRWVPFLDGGGGVSATSIRDSDLSTTFEYNLQAGAGTHYFYRKNAAVTFQYRFLHLSNAGMKFPNLGVNTSTMYLGLSWFY